MVMVSAKLGRTDDANVWLRPGSMVIIAVAVYFAVIGLIFFFQAEDGIRDLTVTGVQTCALPIFKYAGTGAANAAGLIAHIKNAKAPNATTLVVNYVQAPGNVLGQFQQFAILPQHKIGRASCRERV